MCKYIILILFFQWKMFKKYIDYDDIICVNMIIDVFLYGVEGLMYFWIMLNHLELLLEYHAVYNG